MSREKKEVVLAAFKAQEKLSTVSAFIPTTFKEHPNLKKTLESYSREINKAKDVVSLIAGQAALQTSGVVAGLRKMESFGANFQEHLLDLGSGKGEKFLEFAMKQLTSERRTLTSQLRLASVGLEKAEGGATIDIALVRSTDNAVKKLFGKGAGLYIASFVARLNRKPDARGMIRLTDNEYDSMTREQVQIAHPETKDLSPEAKKRIICNCLARDQSIQILGPVNLDLWHELAFVKVEGLVSMDDAIQFGYAVTTEVFMETLDRQDRRINASRATT